MIGFMMKQNQNIIVKTPQLIFASLLLVAGCASMPSHNSANFYVKKDCGTLANCFNNIQSALDAATKEAPDKWVNIDVGEGDYYEKIVISRDKLKLHGQGSAKTRLYYDAFAQTAGVYHRNKWGTPGSATLMINAKDVDVSGIKIENTYDFLANDALADGDAKKVSNSQAVALLLDVDSDRVKIENSSIEGYQDTLFANGKRVYIKNSKISGNVDFIFGNGSVLIEDSIIESRKRAASFKEGEYQSFITAPSTQISQELGIIIYRSKIVREDGVPDNSVALGRPWHPTTKFDDGRYADPNAVGQASFIDCYMDAHINPEHWTFMNGTARDGSKTAIFTAQSSRFSEINSYGPGARHIDIGIKWKGNTNIGEIRTMFFKDWK